MRTLYALTEGAYSDYRVRALFEKKKDAQAAEKALRGDGGYYDTNIEEMAYYPAGEKPEQHVVFHVEMTLLDDGTAYAAKGGAIFAAASNPWLRVATPQTWTRKVWEWDYEPGPPSKRPVAVEVRAPYLNGKGADLRVHGRDKVGVQKAFKDRFAAWAVRSGYTGAMPKVEWEEKA